MTTFRHMNNFSSGDDDDELEDNTTHNTEELSYMDYPEYQASVIIQNTFPPCILLLGGFGNIATIFVMRRIKDHNSSQHIILMALAVSDLTCLFFAAPDLWIRHVFQVDLMIIHGSLCKLITFMFYVSGTTSAWLVTCVTVQRTMAVLWPHRMRVMCTVRKTWTVIAIVILSVCALNSHLLIGLEVIENKWCGAMAGMYDYFLYSIFSWIDLCLASLFPGVCLIVCNVVLSVKLFQALSSSFIDVRVNSNAQSSDSRKKMSYRTTVMVLALSCAFLVLTMPLCVYIVRSNIDDTDTSGYPQAEASDVLLYVVTQQLWYTNSAVNFFLYCLTGAKFRREFVSWIRGDAPSVFAPSSTHETAVEASRG